MKVSKYFKFILGLLIGCVGICTASLTAAWFTYTAQIKGAENELIGSSEGAYYARGRGTPEDPFIINKPRHLYNLAWLQYLGRYNKVESGKVNQTYFAIDPRKDESDTTDYSNWYLDMSGEVLPPIGTETYPFLGNFDGRGYTIKNLTTSNEYGTADGDVKKKPAMVNLTDNQLEGVNIVGAFGVVGDIDGTYEGKYKKEKENIDPETGETSIEKILSVHDVNIENSNVVNNLGTSLVGMIAGYSDGDLSNIGVVNSSLDLKENTSVYKDFDNVSNYSTVGFCTDEYVDKINKEITTVYTPKEENIDPPFTAKDTVGDGANWGGSINMKDMYEGLKTNFFDQYYVNSSIRTNQTIKYVSSKTIVYDENDNPSEPTNVVESASPAYKNTYFFNDKVYDSVDNKQTASITQGIWNANNYEPQKYMCMSGYRVRTVNNGLRVTETRYDQNKMYRIYCEVDGLKYYLNRNGNNINYATNEAATNLWAFDNGKIYQRDGATKYYLYQYSTTEVRVQTNETGNWSYDLNEFNFLSVGTGVNLRYLVFKNFNWTLVQDLTERITYYTISTGGRYLVASYNNGRTSFSSTTDASDATLWLFDNNNYGNFYIIINSTKYYLCLTSSYQYNNQMGTYTYSLGIDPSISYRVSRSSSSTSYLTSNYDGYNVYLGLYNNNIVASESTNYRNRFTFTRVDGDEVTYNLKLNETETKIQYTQTITQNAIYECPDTYFPLKSKTNSQGQVTEFAVPDKTNTGYIVSGAEFDSQTTNQVGDIRISSFNLTPSLRNSGGASLTTVYTIDDNSKRVSHNSYNQNNTNLGQRNGYGTVINASVASRFEKYETSKSQLIEKGLTGSAVYGLHFMEASIAKDYRDSSNNLLHETRIPKAYINGKEYANYQVPHDAIDFNLKEKGYINFFAGTYFFGSNGDNDSFFSLHKIYRPSETSNDINVIKEIQYIYKPKAAYENYSYIYQFTDGTYSKPFKFMDGKKVTLDSTENSVTYVNDFIPPSSADTTMEFSSYYETTPCFKTSWIKRMANGLIWNAAYYFEIPMNDGEYALGCDDTSGSVGCYLMYLDIGANAAVNNRVIVNEKFTWENQIFSFPKGVAVISAGSTNISDKNSYCVTIKNETSGTITLKINSDTEGEIVRTGSMGSGSELEYVSEGLTIKEGSNNFDYRSQIPLDKSLTTLLRTSFYDYRPSDGTTLKTVFEKTKVDSGAWSSTTIKKYGADGKEDQSLKIYDNEGRPITSYTIDDAAMNNANVALMFKTVFGYGGQISHDFLTKVTTKPDNNGTIYCTVNAYDITLTFTIESGYVLDPNSAHVTIIGISNNTLIYKINETIVTTNANWYVDISAS